MVKRLTILGVFFVAMFATFLLSTVTLAQGTVPANGCFVGSLADWIIFGGTSYQIAGHGSCGAAKLYYWGGAATMSRPFVTLNGQLTFWEKYESNGGQLTVSVKNWQTNTLTPVYQAGGSADWTSHTVAVGGDGTSKLSVLFQASAGDTTTAIWVSDISLNTGSTPGLNTGAYINGDFSQNLRNWHPFYGGWGVDGTVGHTAVPAAYTDNNPYDNRNRMISIPFIVTAGQTSWTIWSKSRSALYVDVQVLDGTGTWTSVLANAESCSDWCVRSFSLTNQLSQPVVLQVWPQGGWGALYIDDVCPAVGCLGWADPPTPTPGATATQGGGGGPYPTIDWSQFPTQAPYPTFPPFPTQAPYPTSIYGPGTPQPITGSVTISGTVKIDDSTPVRVKIDDSTPVAVKVDDRTPVRVMFGNGPNYTAVPWQNSGGEQRAPSSGSVLPTLITSPSQSSIQYGQAGSSANPLNFHLQQVDYYFANVGVQPLGLSFNLLIHYYYPDAFSLAGIDILPGLYGLAAVYVLVVIIRQLQAR